MKLLLKLAGVKVTHDGPRHTQVARGNFGVAWWAKGTTSGVEHTIYAYRRHRADYRFTWWRAG